MSLHCPFYNDFNITGNTCILSNTINGPDACRRLFSVGIVGTVATAGAVSYGTVTTVPPPKSSRKAFWALMNHKPI